MTTATTTVPKLTYDQAKALIAAQREHERCAEEAKIAKMKRDDLMARYADRLPVGQPIRAAGHLIERSVSKPGRKFDFARYKELYKLTKRMEECLTDTSPRKSLKVTEAN